LVVLQVKQQVQDFKDREARVAEAEQHALSYSSREAALTARQHSMAALEDKAQQANAAAEYARKEADAMWDKQKVTTHPADSGCLSMCARVHVCACLKCCGTCLVARAIVSTLHVCMTIALSATSFY